MSELEEIARLRTEIARYERNATKSSWLLRQLGSKIRNFPRDFSQRMRKSREKKRNRKLWGSAIAPPAAHASAGLGAAAPEAKVVPTTPESGFMSAPMQELVAAARALEPEIGDIDPQVQHFTPPGLGGDFPYFKALKRTIPKKAYDAVVLMPAGRMGGADLVAAVLSQALSQKKTVLILRTDDSHWDRPDWFPEAADSLDISPGLKPINDKARALFLLLRYIDAPEVFNVNSRLAFETFIEFGRQLSHERALYAYYFCADRTPLGTEAGYPVWYFHPLLKHLTAALLDTHYLADLLTDRYAVPDGERHKLVTLYTPAQQMIAETPVPEQTPNGPARQRPRILWAGRLDRQKRFELVVEIAQAMPEVDFMCWGKAVLDAPPNTDRLPGNMKLHPPFTDYDDLPLADSDGWLYTSAWDGLPTILIELGALGMPIVASAVGGVPELIDETTGWSVAEDATVADYADAIRAMIADPGGRKSRGRALQARVRDRHSMETYVGAVEALGLEERDRV